MASYDRAGVPYFPGVGNHDRKSPPGVPPGTGGLFNSSIQGSVTNYKSVFAGRPYPFGDAAPYKDSNFSQRSRPANDPAGASTHYFVDYGKVRWIFIDNSCWGLSDCDASQNPSFPDAQGNTSQLQYLERTAERGALEGHDRVRGDAHAHARPARPELHRPDHLQPRAGQGPEPVPGAGQPEASRRSRGAAASTALFVGHIKGQFLYRGQGGIPYYIDGGAGGELYTEGPVGADHGYWHGFRLVRVAGGRVTTDTVPIFIKDGIRLEGPDTRQPGPPGPVRGVRQPTGVQRPGEGAEPRAARSRPGPAHQRRGDRRVRARRRLDLRAGDAARAGRHRDERHAAATAPPGAGAGLRRRRRGVMGVAGASLAQQSEPTTTPLESLPIPAHIFTTSDPQVLAPRDRQARRPAPRRPPSDRGRAVRIALPRPGAREHHLRIRDHGAGACWCPPRAAGSHAGCAP